MKVERTFPYQKQPYQLFVTTLCKVMQFDVIALKWKRRPSASLVSVLQQLYQIQQVTMPAGQELTQPMFIQSTNQTVDAQVTQVTQVTQVSTE